MLMNLAAGSILVLLTSIIHGVGLLALSQFLKLIVHHRPPTKRRGKVVGFVLITVLGLFGLHTIEIWVWAIAYLLVGGFETLHDALFFSTLSFSTLGAEDISVATEWRLFGSIEGVNGFLLIGWSTAYLFPAWLRYGPFHEDNDF